MACTRSNVSWMSNAFARGDKKRRGCLVAERFLVDKRGGRGVGVWDLEHSSEDREEQGHGVFTISLQIPAMWWTRLTDLRS
jgi:hypothetical protein